jgi:hypothetical protein
LAAGDVVQLATDKTTADAFYGVTFINLVDSTSNSLGNGGEVLQILNALNTVIFEMEYSDDSPWPTEADGDGPSLELQNPNGDFNDGTNWAPAINLVGQDAGVDVLASPGNFIPNTTNVPEISFAETAYSIAEDGTSVEITIDISSPSTSPIAVDVTLVTELLTATQDLDFVFMNLIDLSLFDIQRRELLSATQVSSLKLTSLNTGTYIIKTCAVVTKK